MSGGGKETPRQKMIGMMYLFLTAMLALNVSKDVLDSFIIVNDGLTTTVENFKEKNDKIYADFEKQRTLNAAKVEKWGNYANQIRDTANAISDYLKSLKIEIVTISDGPECPAIVDGEVVTKHIAGKDNIDIGAQVMVGAMNNGKGVVLKKRIEDFREFMLSLIPDTEANAIIRSSIGKNLNTDAPEPHDGIQPTWESGLFEHIPLVGVVTILTKMQGDIRNAESDILRYLYGQIDAGDFKFNVLEGMVMPKNSMVMTGEEFSAKVFVAAFDSTQAPEIYVGPYEKTADGGYKMSGSNPSKLKIEGGMGVYKTTSRKVGLNEWGGLIVMKAPDGSQKQYPFKNSFMVSEPMAIISASANTVFYQGIANPLEVSVPGLAMDKIYPSITGAELRKKKDFWEVIPKQSGGRVTVNVAAEIDGRRQNVGKKEFRIMQVPPPTPYVAGQNGGTMSASALAAGAGITADLKGFIMENIKYVVKSYTVVTQSGVYTEEINNAGWRFNDQTLGKIRGLKRGGRITFENIIATGPSGDVNLGSMVFKIN